MTSQSTALDPGKLAAMVGSRLCHDIISPLGAIGNGLELLELAGADPEFAQSPEMRLIVESLEAAKAMVEAYRIAFGPGQGAQYYRSANVQKLARAAVGRSNIAVEAIITKDLPRSEMRLFLLAAMCAAATLPRGGSITLQNVDTAVKVTARASSVQHEPELWAWLGPNQAQQRPLTPSEVQFGLLPLAAREADRNLICQKRDDSITILL